MAAFNVARPCWVYPGAYIELDIDAQNRVTEGRVTCPDGYVAHAEVHLANGVVLEGDFQPGTTVVPVSKPVPQDFGSYYTIGVTPVGGWPQPLVRKPSVK